MQKPVPEIKVLDFRQEKDITSFATSYHDLTENCNPTQLGFGPANKNKKNPYILVIISPHQPTDDEEYGQRLQQITRLTRSNAILLVAVDAEPKFTEKPLDKHILEMYHDKVANSLPFEISFKKQE